MTLGVEPEDDEEELFGTLVGDLQEDISVEDDTIEGTLKYYDEESSLVTQYGAGNFLALKFTSNADKVMAGLEPSMGSGLVELDSDMNGVWYVTNNNTQRFKVVTYKGTEKFTKLYSLEGLTCETE